MGMVLAWARLPRRQGRQFHHPSCRRFPFSLRAVAAEARRFLLLPRVAPSPASCPAFRFRRRQPRVLLLLLLLLLLLGLAALMEANVREPLLRREPGEDSLALAQLDARRLEKDYYR